MTSLIYTNLKQAFEIKKNPLPWIKAISAGVAAALPAFIGLLFGQLQYGLLAVIGSFTFLYMFNEPYVQRAKKLFFVLLGISFSVGLGTLLAPFPIAQAFTVGIIGMVATFIFGALKIPGPAAIFFVLAFTMTSAMPVDPALAPVRTGFVFLGGVLSWLIAMVGWFFNPRRPEINAVRNIYKELAALLDATGTERFSEARHQTVLKIKAAEEVLKAGYAPWGKPQLYKRLYLLYEQANAIFLEILENDATNNTKLSAELGEFLRTIVKAIDNKDNNISLDTIGVNDIQVENTELIEKVRKAGSILIDELSEESIRISKPSFKTIFGGNIHKNSIVFVSALRYGFILMIAALIAHAFGFDRSYWVTLSCAAVMLGSTIMSTFHRAIQRSFGTIIGILIAMLLLSSHPEGLVIVIIIFCLTTLTELFIVRNYALAVFFITPNAIFMAENTTQIYDLSFFAATRITDIFIGCIIGLVGIFLIGRRSASSRLPHLIAKSIRSQMQFIVLLFSVQKGDIDLSESKESRKMHTNLTNLKVVYTTALGEIPNNRKVLEFLWPVMFSIEHLGYLLDASAKHPGRPMLSDANLAQLLLVFETMAKSVEHKQLLVSKVVPNINGFPHIEKEIKALQEALQIGGQASIKYGSKRNK
ncbi:FUSC family protein [Virgibacillus alimentarius]|uniref:Membrane protein YccC n=1 Tax=Virgibacillus alimentarius TaxID=698769 RepID=A0ABS4S6R6_9BACI|nr:MULTISPECIES: FUSC family protein [Virgibacillus]MBP2257171.1 putative membrane protein YccC [Virgibacillus alimentarius]HLR69399.1 FUSC family protein [Virgibacillus sp.]